LLNCHFSWTGHVLINTNCLHFLDCFINYLVQFEIDYTNRNWPFEFAIPLFLSVRCIFSGQNLKNLENLGRYICNVLSKSAISGRGNSIHTLQNCLQMIDVCFIWIFPIFGSYIKVIKIHFKHYRNRNLLFDISS
jgi:hypothetical protein